MCLPLGTYRIWSTPWEKPSTKLPELMLGSSETVWKRLGRPWESTSVLGDARLNPSAVRVQVAVEDRACAAVLDARVLGDDDADLDVGVEHVGGPADALDRHLHGLGVEPAGADRVIAHERRRIERFLVLLRGHPAHRLEQQVDSLLPLVLGQGDRRLRSA